MALEKAGSKLGRLKARLEIARVTFHNASMCLHNTNARRIERKSSVDSSGDNVVRNQLQDLRKAQKKMTRLQGLVVAAKVSYRQKLRKFRSEVQQESSEGEVESTEDTDDSN